MIFVDTSFWAAFHNRRDDRYEDAKALLRGQRSGRFVTTNHIRGETWTLLRRRVGQWIAVRFLDALDTSERTSVVYVPEDVEADALRWLRRHEERPYSFVDATSFLLMRSLKMRDVFTFDDDFRAAGFRVIES